MHRFPDWTDRICACKEPSHAPKYIALTGGPGAGKTAVLEIARRSFCHHTLILPESAGIIYGGGFWRGHTIGAKKAAQRAIYFVQREQEELVRADDGAAVCLCDRGTLDGLAYWPDTEKSYFAELATTKEKEFAKYAAVIHLRTPAEHEGYNNQNPLRTETADMAAEIDKHIGEIWKTHPHYSEVTSTTHFLEKVRKVMTLIFDYMPECCLRHHQPLPGKIPGPE